MSCYLLALPAVAQTDTVSVVPGERYQAGGLQQKLLGGGYRGMWTSPMRVPVLDITSELGGLTPVERGGNVQTMALRFRAPDGSEYNFRSIDKELTPALPSYAQETLVDWIRQDLTSAQLPIAPVLVTPILDAVGVLNPDPRVVVLPDVPELGEFREDYRGMLGTFEHHPNEIEEGVGGFAGSVEVKGTEGMLDDVEDDPVNRVDAREFLAARLVDMLVGDWDRHEGQWRWARYDDANGIRWWRPIPEDRDYAFVAYGGLLVDIGRLIGLGRLVSYDEEFASFTAMMANSLSMNRRILAELDRAAWDSVAAFVQSSVTDSVIAEVMARIPDEARGGVVARIEPRLRARRDGLTRLASRYYRYMAEMVEIHTTDADEIAALTRLPGGAVRVDVRTVDGLPVYHRVFDPAETEEIRLDLHGGDDRATVTGGSGGITIRILGGGGDDVLEDRGRGRTALYDDRGDNQLAGGRGTRIDTRPYDAPAGEGGLLPSSNSDWGTSARLVPTADWRSHVGVVLGVSLRRTRYGFRQHPHSSRHTLTAFASPLSGRGALEYRGTMPLEGSPRWLEWRGDATTMNAVRFHGFGNDSEAAGPESRVWLRELSLASRWHVPIGGGARIVPGLEARYTEPRFQGASPVANLQPLGSEPFGRVTASTSLLLDTRDVRWYPRRGIDATVTASATPPVWDISDPYSRLDASAATYLPLPPLDGPVLALRAGGSRVWGAAPFQESAFLGGSHTLRGYQRERFAGDGAVFGSAELRVPLFEVELGLRGDLGVTGLVDAGRVYVDGESPGGWHHSRGGGLWFATPAISGSLTYAFGEDHRVYADFGFPF